MSGFFNVTTIPRAIFLGFILMFFALGVTSLYNLIVADAERASPNTLAYFALGGFIAGLTGYLFRDQHIMSLKAQGRLDPDSDGSELPIGGSPSTIPRLLVYILLMTFVVQGIITLLSMAGLWWSRSADWGDWFVTVVVTSPVGLMTYFQTRKDHTAEPLGSHGASDDPAATH